MKDFIENVIRIKEFVSLFFAGAMALYMAIGWLFFGMTEMPFIFILQAFVLALAIGLLWQAVFTDMLFKKLRYSLRLLVFVLAMLVVLSALMALFYRFPTDFAKLWLLVAGLMVVGAAAFSLICEIYSRVYGQKLNAMLSIYKEQNKNSAGQIFQ